MTAPRLRREIQLNWRFVGRDASTTIIPGMLFLIAAGTNRRMPMEVLLPTLLRGLTYFWLYVTIFCLSNQLVGMEEDRANKPDRPLVSGAVSRRGAYVRWLAAMLLFPLLAWWFGGFDVLKWALLWQIVVLLHNFLGWGDRWITKNAAMMLGTMAQLAAAWQLAAPTIPAEAWRWILLISLVVFPLVSVQDLRDMTGDRTIGRRTMPLAVGEHATRWFVCICFILVIPAIHFGLMRPAGLNSQVIACDLAVAGISLLIALRVVTRRLPRHDHRTYMLFTYWYCGLLASAIVVFAR